jgi:hypothetical protein
MLKSSQFWIGAATGTAALLVLIAILLFLDANQITVSVKNLTRAPIRAEVWLTDHLQSSFDVPATQAKQVSFQTSDASLRVKIVTATETLEYEFGYVTHTPPQDLYMVRVTDHLGLEAMQAPKPLSYILYGSYY